MRIQYKTDHEIELQRAAGLVAAEILEAMCVAAKVGTSTWELDQIARAGIARHAKLVELEVHETAKKIFDRIAAGTYDRGAEEALTRTYVELRPIFKNGKPGREADRAISEVAERHKVISAFLGYAQPPYPAVVCTSINEEIVHGIPSKTHVLKDGDIIGIDFGIYKHGFCADTARTVLVGDVAEDRKKLVRVCKESLDRGITEIKVGGRLGDVGAAIQNHAESHGYSVVRQFVGHGTGRQMHEDPQVPNYGKPGTEKRIKTGLVIAVEPMVNAGAPELEVLDDGWTAVTKDRKMSAHFEHTIAVTDNGPWVLTDPASQKP